MYLDRKLSGNNIFNYFTLSQRDNWRVEYSEQIVPNVPKERLARLYLDIYPQNVPTAQNAKSKCILVSDNQNNALWIKYIILKK